MNSFFLHGSQEPKNINSKDKLRQCEESLYKARLCDESINKRTT